MNAKAVAQLSYLFRVAVVCTCLIGAISESVMAKDTVAAATVDEARAAIDLGSLPRFKALEKPADAQISSLNYQSSGTVKDAYTFHRDQLKKAGWKQGNDESLSDSSATASFTKDHFVLSIMVMQIGNPSEISVSIRNHGNISLNALPVPAKTVDQFSSPLTRLALAPGSVEQTTQDLNSLLVKQGWTPYGEAGPQRFYRNHAVRLTVMIIESPAQQGKTMISFSAEQLSAVLPAPEGVKNLQYSDMTHHLLFDTNLSEADIVKFYQATLAKEGWEPTTENLLDVEFRKMMIFRNPAMDLIQIETYKFDDDQRVEVKWQSAAEVEELERLAKKAIADRKMKAEMKSEKDQILIILPEAAQEVESSPTRIEFNLETGAALVHVAAIRKQLEEKGWKLDDKSKETKDVAGTITMQNGDQSVIILYVDPGFIPAQITLNAQGGEFQLDEKKK